MSVQNYMPEISELIPNRLYSQKEEKGNLPAYWTLVDGTYISTSWSEYVTQIEQIARALIALKVDEQETIGLLGFNRPEWTSAAHAAMSVRAVSVGIYTTSSSSDIDYVVGHASMSLIIVETLEQYNRVANVRQKNPQLKYIICMKSIAPEDVPEGDGVMSWDDFISLGTPIDPKEVHKRRERIEQEDLATLIYTSGTTGRPKGVMLSHRAITSAAWTLLQMVNLTPKDRLLSYLPLSHIVEQVISVYAPAYIGFSIYFAQSMETIAENIKQSQPTIFFGVPRIWEKFYEGINTKLGAATGIKKSIAHFAQTTGVAYHQQRMNGQKPSALLSLKYKLANKLVFSKLKTALGMGDVRGFYCGAAPLSHHILTFFTGLDICICEAYGLSENAGPGIFNLPERTRFGTVGKSVPGVNVKIAEDGEILLAGSVLFSGYYRDPDETTKTLNDGWLYTGDLGSIDEDGFVAITGRKKDVIITAGGKNISPRKIEALMEAIPLVENCVVVGDQQKFMSALLTINQEVLSAWAKSNDKSLDDIFEDDAFKKVIQESVTQANDNLARVEQIREFRILDKNFTIDDGDLTPTLKVKRKAIIEKNKAIIDNIYS